jgi:SagB-type dehydrogenase family enzyme
MRNRLALILVITLILIGIGGLIYFQFNQQKPSPNTEPGDLIILPTPILDSQTSVEQSLLERKSIREYSPDPLTLEEISQLLWAAQGINRPGGYRTSPSAGALYPLNVYLVSGEVVEIPAGVYKYIPEQHALQPGLQGDVREELTAAALGQEAVRNAPAVILISAVYERTTGKYGDRGIRYVHMEVGTAAENVYLQAVSLDLGTVFIGAFYDDQVSQVLKLAPQEQPLCIMPIGKINP